MTKKASGFRTSKNGKVYPVSIHTNPEGDVEEVRAMYSAAPSHKTEEEIMREIDFEEAYL